MAQELQAKSSKITDSSSPWRNKTEGKGWEECVAQCLEYKSQVVESSTQVVQKYPNGICLHNFLFIILRGSGKEFYIVKTQKEQVFRRKATSKPKAVILLLYNRPLAT